MIATQRRAVVAASLVGIAGVLVVGLKPLLVNAYIGSLGFTRSQAGLLVALDMAGGMAGNLLGSWRLYRLSRTGVAVAALLTIAGGNVLSLSCDVFVPLALVRLMTGLGAGVGASVMATVLSSTRAPERSYAFYASLAFLVSACAMWMSSLALVKYGVEAMFAGLAAVALVPLAFTRWLRPRESSTRDRDASASTPPASLAVDRLGVLALLAGTVLFYAVTGGIYSFMSQMGLEHHIEASVVNAGLGLSQLGGAMGSVVPLLLGLSVGRAKPITVSSGLLIVSTLLIGTTGDATLYMFAMCTFVFAWLAFFPYLMGVCALFDPSGRLSALNLALQYAGLTVGSAMAGVVSERVGYHALVVGAAVGYAISALLVLDGERRSRQMAFGRRPLVPEAA
jgi:predicted MFS family arabinose efflux permease